MVSGGPPYKNSYQWFNEEGCYGEIVNINYYYEREYPQVIKDNILKIRDSMWKLIGNEQCTRIFHVESLMINSNFFTLTTTFS